MSVRFCVVSIGALSHNRLWSEAVPLRTAHATTTYIVDGERRILTDPSLPATALAARFNERTGKTLADVTDVFCTTLRPVHRRSLEALPDAAWWVNELELQTYSEHLEKLLASAERLSDQDAHAIRADMKLLAKFSPAPDAFTPQISLFPTPGPSPGAAGLLLTPTDMTIAVAGDAALTGEHVERGQVWQGCADTEAAMESLGELVEIADMIIPGHDNLIVTPRGRWL